MAEYADERDDHEEVVDEEGEVEEGELGEDQVDELTEAQKAEAADLVKLLRQHPEIWIPYEDQVLEQLKPRSVEAAPGPEAPTLTVSLRDIKSLDSKHSTYPFLTNYERTKCISFRASQICNGAMPYIVVPEGVSDAYEIAKLELEAKRLPFIIKRPLPDGNFEAWRLSDLMIF